VKKTKNILLVASIFLLAQNAFSQTTIYGGRGLLRVHSAEVIGKSQFYINSFFMSFLQAEKSQTSLGKDYTLSLGLTFGLTPHLEITSLITPYQDDQSHIWGPPGDSQIGIKFQTPFSGSSIITAGRVFVKIPTARNYNIPFEPYSSDKVGLGLMGIATFDMTNSFPLFPLKMHINFGYMDHNVSDSFFADEEDQFLVRVGLKFPIRSSVLFTEYSAEIFANSPVVDRYSLNSQRITQGLKFLGPWNLIFDVAIDISLSQKPEDDSISPFLKKYADWKLVAGINYPMRIRKNRPSRQDRLAKQKDEEAKKRLEEVHENRQKVDEKLQKMQESLQSEEKKKKKKNKSDNEKQ
jgi:hypothetical protein